MFKVWDYENKYLGTVEADTLGAAMKAARAKWPDRLTGNRLFPVVTAYTDDVIAEIVRAVSGIDVKE